MSARLPDKPSELLVLALSDLEKCEAHPDLYAVEMGAWHEPQGEGKPCLVCVAGAVMAQTLSVAHDEFHMPSCFRADQRTAQALRAIDDLRAGSVCAALLRLEIPNPGIRDRTITPYESDRRAFKADVLQLAADLRAEGL